MLAHRLRRWPNIGQTLARCVVFAGLLWFFCRTTRPFPRAIATFSVPQLLRQVSAVYRAAGKQR